MANEEKKPEAEDLNGIGLLAEALSKAQGQMEAAAKDKDNPFFKSKYADLASVWGACRKPLADNGLAVIQTTQGSFDSMVLITTLAHKSGQTITCPTPIKMQKQDMQGMGAAITYARRFSLAAMVGVYQDDTDGEESKEQENKEPAPTAFDVQMKRGMEAIENGRSTADKVIGHLEKKWQLSQDHIDAIKAVKVK